jgi:uncharacterized protein involved in tolerance to divalent cations
MTGSLHTYNYGGGKVEVLTTPFAACVKRKSGVSDESWQALCDQAGSVKSTNTTVKTSSLAITAKPENIRELHTYDVNALENALTPLLGQAAGAGRSRG